MAFEPAIELDKEELTLHLHQVSVDEGRQIAVTLQRRAGADVDDDLAEAHGALGQCREVVCHDVERTVGATAHRVGIMSQLILHPTIGEDPVTHRDAFVDAQFRTGTVRGSVAHAGHRRRTGLDRPAPPE